MVSHMQELPSFFPSAWSGRWCDQSKPNKKRGQCLVIVNKPFILLLYETTLEMFDVYGLAGWSVWNLIWVMSFQNSEKPDTLG